MKVSSLVTPAALLAAFLGLAACDRERSGPDPQSGPAAEGGAPAAGGTATPGNPGTAGGAPAASTGADRSAGTALDDGGITAKVKTALLADPQVQGLRIDVDTRSGTVTLSGAVASADQAQRAVEIARNVEGVREVNNELTVGQG